MKYSRLLMSRMKGRVSGDGGCFDSHPQNRDFSLYATAACRWHWPHDAHYRDLMQHDRRIHTANGLCCLKLSEHAYHPLRNEFISKLETNLLRRLEVADRASNPAASHLQPTNRLSLATNVIIESPTLSPIYARKRMKFKRRKMGKIFSQVFPACKAWICVWGDRTSVAGEARSPNWKNLRGTFTFDRNAQVREAVVTSSRPTRR